MAVNVSEKHVNFLNWFVSLNLSKACEHTFGSLEELHGPRSNPNVIKFMGNIHISPLQETLFEDPQVNNILILNSMHYTQHVKWVAYAL